MTRIFLLLVALLPMKGACLLVAQDNSVNVRFSHLEVQLDTDQKRIAGTQSLYLSPDNSGTSLVFKLHPNLEVVRLSIDGHPTPFVRKGESVEVSLPRGGRRRTESEISILYAGPLPAPIEAYPSGQISLSNEWLPPHYWWPTLAQMVDSMAITLIQPEESYWLVSGALISMDRRPGRFLAKTYSLNGPVNPHDVYLIQGPYTRLEESILTQNGTTSLQWVLPDDAKTEATAQLAMQQEMVGWLEDVLGPYPANAPGLTRLQTKGLEIGSHEEARWFTAWANQWMGSTLFPSDTLATRIVRSLQQYLYFQYVSQLDGEQVARQYIQDSYPQPLGAAMWYTWSHTYDNGNSPENWIPNLLRDFRGEYVDGETLIKWLEGQGFAGLEPAAVQYLLYQQPPVLKFQLTQQGRRYGFRCRWQAEAEGFTLPVYVWVNDEPIKVEAGTTWVEWESRSIAAPRIEIDRTRGLYEIDFDE